MTPSAENDAGRCPVCKRPAVHEYGVKSTCSAAEWTTCTRVIPPGYCSACMEGEDSGLAHTCPIPPEGGDRGSR